LQDQLVLVALVELVQQEQALALEHLLGLGLVLD